MTGFDWPLQVARMAGGTGRVRDLLTTRPVIFGNASVALAMHVLPASARPPSAASKTAAIADIIRFRICPALKADAELEHSMQDVSIGGCACAAPVDGAVRSQGPSVGQHGPYVSLGNGDAVDLG